MWELKTAVFLHWCLICAVPLPVTLHIKCVEFELQVLIIKLISPNQPLPHFGCGQATVHTTYLPQYGQ
jgi:hypothetical protein